MIFVFARARPMLPTIRPRRHRRGECAPASACLAASPAETARPSPAARQVVAVERPFELPTAVRRPVRVKAVANTTDSHGARLASAMRVTGAGTIGLHIMLELARAHHEAVATLLHDAGCSDSVLNSL